MISKGEFYPKEKKGNIGYDVPVNFDNYIYDKLSYMSNFEKKYDYTNMYFDQ